MAHFVLQNSYQKFVVAHIAAAQQAAANIEPIIGPTLVLPHQ